MAKKKIKKSPVVSRYCGTTAISDLVTDTDIALDLTSLQSDINYVVNFQPTEPVITSFRHITLSITGFTPSSAK